MANRGATIFLDLRGVKCPLNWAYAKVRLEKMDRGDMLDLALDDPRGARDIPLAAEAEGFAVIEVADLFEAGAQRASVAGAWRVKIEK
jgi:TusA-related sulfurtransferase